MPSRPFKQASFVAGIISPELFARLDVERVAVGCREVKNFIINVSGAAKNRQGSEYISDAVRRKGGISDRVRLIPFIFNEDQAYAVEFGDERVRFFRSGAVILDPGGTHGGGVSATVFKDLSRSFVVSMLIDFTITNVTTGNSAVITANDQSTITVASITGSFNDGDVITLDAPLVIPSPFTKVQLEGLKFTQANDIMTITHRARNVRPHELQRHGDDSWLFRPVSTTNPVNPPTGLAHTNAWDGTNSTHPVKQITHVATAVDSNGTESLPSVALIDVLAVQYPDKTKGKYSLVAPLVGNTPVTYNWYRGNDGVYGFVGSSDNLTFVDEGFEPDIFETPPTGVDPFIYIETLEGNSQDGNAVGGAHTLTPSAGVAFKTDAIEAFNDTYTYTIKLDIPTLTFIQRWIDVVVRLESRPAGGGSWLDRGTHIFRHYHVGSGGVQTNPVSIHAPNFVLDGVVLDHEFRIVDLGSTEGSGFHTLTLLNVTYAAELTTDVGNAVNNYPAVVGYFEQRLVFASFARNRQQIVTSRSGDFDNFDHSKPTRDDDSVDLTIASGRLDEIRGLLHMEALWLFTPGGLWRLTGVEGERLTPSSFSIKRLVQYGSSKLDPLAVGPTALFHTDRGKKVRELLDTEEKQGARDLTSLAPHLLRRKTIEEWAYAEDPDTIVWCVRSDGALLGLTYSVEHDVWAWHEHTTTGTYESVCVVPEGNIDAVYVSVLRTINGVTTRMIERFGERWDDTLDIGDAVFLDSAIKYTGVITYFDGTANADHEYEIDNGTTYAVGSVMRINGFLSPDKFVSGDIGSQFLIRINGNEYRFDVTAVPTASRLTVTLTHVNNVAAGVVAVADRELGIASPENNWSFARLTFSGADHLEGETVTVLADGAVGTKVVTSGVITFTTHKERVTAGLSYVSDLSPLLSVHGRGGAARDMTKLLGTLGIEVDQWRGLEVGTNAATLDKVQQRDVSDVYEEVGLGPELISFNPKTGWTKTPTLLIRQSDPLPVSVLAVIPDVSRETTGRRR